MQTRDDISAAAFGKVGVRDGASPGARVQVPTRQPWQRRVALLGVGVDDLTMTETVAMIEKFIASRTFHQIATANVDFLYKAAGDEELNNILRSCALTLADGMPLIWASRMLGCPLRERVAGADLVLRVLELSEQKAYRVFLLGASPESSLEAHRSIQQKYPKAVICGRLSPPLAPLEKMDHEAILAAIEEAEPDILLTAFGNPKQEKWVAMHKDRLRVPVCIGVGGSLDFVSGKQSRAPRWMQRTGTEWAFRLGSQPRRLSKRYTSDGLFLTRYLSAQLLAHSSQIRCGEPEAAFNHSDGALEVRLQGNFTGSILERIETEMATRPGALRLLINASGCTYIGADGIGWLLRTSDRLEAEGGEVVLVSVNHSVRVALRAALIGRSPLKMVSSTPELPHAPGATAPGAFPLSKVIASPSALSEATLP